MATFRVTKSRLLEDSFTVIAPDEEAAYVFATDIDFEGANVVDHWIYTSLVSDEDEEADYDVES